MSRWLIVALVIVAVTCGLNAAAFAGWFGPLPDKVPIHWGATGEADGWTSPDNWFVIFGLFPVIQLGLFALLMVLPWLSPVQFKVEGFRPTYDYVVALVMLLFTYMNAMFMYAQLHGPNLPERAFFAGFFLFFALLGNVLGKVKPNFWMGIRTPWTLASPKVWDRTHRLGAWLFVAVGGIGFVATLLGVNPLICFAALMAGALFPVLYSLLLYKRLEASGELQ